MFHQCPKCKRVWQYPIEKCPDCFSVLEKINSKRAKVVGVSRVSIPTIFHSKVPYFVLVLEDEKGNKWVQKSVKEYKIGQEFKIESGQNKNAVAIWRVKYDISEGIEQITQILEEISIKDNSKVLILPTLVLPTHPYLRDNTSPEYLSAVLEFLLGKGVKAENIKIAAQSFNEISVGASAQKSQLLEVCQRFKVLPLDLAETNFVKKEVGNTTFELSEEVFNSDFVLNLPLLKMGRASATENILKFLKKENYLGLKYLYSDKEIIENLILASSPPSRSGPILPRIFTLAEAEMVQKSDKYTLFLGILLASFNSLNLDRVFFEITQEKNLPEILKKIKIESIPILGRKIEEVSF